MIIFGVAGVVIPLGISGVMFSVLRGFSGDS